MKKPILIISSTVLVLAVGIIAYLMFNNRTVSDTVIDVTQHGVVANDITKAENNTKTIKRLVKKMGVNCTVYFPNGEYYVSAKSGFLKLNNKHTIVFKGDNATLINTSFNPSVTHNYFKGNTSSFFHINNCSDVMIDGLNFDFLSYTNLLGTIISSSEKETKVKLNKAYIDGTNKNALTGNEYISSIIITNKNGKFISESYANITEKYPARIEGDYYIIDGKFGKAGDNLTARFSCGTYSGPIFSVQNTARLTVQNINIYSTPSASFYCMYGNEDFVFKNVNVGLRDGSVQHLASNEDCIHIKGLRGSLTIADCNFSGIGDDALNVHSKATYIKSAKYTNGQAVLTLIDKSTNFRVSDNWCRVGDTLAFYTSTYNNVLNAEVLNIKGNKITIKTDTELPSGCFVQNLTATPTVTVENTTAENGRARGFLLQARNADIRNCRFNNLGLSAILVSTDIVYWFELGPSENVNITDCTFNDVGTRLSGDNYGAITVNASHDGNSKNYKNVHKNINITDNSFNNILLPAAAIYATQNVNLKNNTIENTKDFVFINCNNVVQ